ncbi:efflux RND transporter permease subunit [Inmirania thermothiophila]|uniref:SSD domain-containing protein n=1 Tax=Inmirania thermothiophila TaxID=1750597 RepID=A0A3N1Y7D5_9GAMM|nr:MMPL family transporter [Inmirania thermothiophila]ROR34734.1 hypothetical protein EDC57_0638 [Inmirania thermothiophila]
MTGPRLLPPRLALALLLGLLVLAALPLRGLRLDNTPPVYYPPDAPAVVLDRRLRALFPDDASLFVLLEGGDLLAPAGVARIDRAVRAIEALPGVDRVLAVTTVEHIGAAEDGFAVERLLDPANPLPAEAARARVLGDRFAPGLLVSRDGGSVALVVRPRTGLDSLARLRLERGVRAALEAAGLGPRLAALGGDVALDVAEFRSMVRDSAIFIPATTVAGLLLLGWMYRRWLAVAAAVAVMGVAVLVPVAAVVLAGQPYTLVTAMLPPLMAALATALLIHLFNAVAHADHRGHRGAERVRRALAEVERPARYTALTTAAGLASLGTSPMPPVATFGLAAALGVAALYAAAVVLLPAVLARWDRGAWPRRGGLRAVGGAVRALGRLGARRAGWVVAATLAGAAVSVPLIARVEVQTDLYRFFDEGHPLTRATRLIEERLTGVTPLEVLLQAPGRDGLTEPVRLAAIRELQRFAEALPEVARTLSVADLVEEMNWAFHGEDPAARRVPDDRRLVAQYLFVYDGNDLWELADRELAATRVLIHLRVHGSREIGAVIDTLRARLQAHPPADLAWAVGGGGRLFRDQERLLVVGQVRSILAALALILALMALLWRSLGEAVLCMIPNLAPVVLIFAVMGAAGVWLDVATVLIASVAVGIAVDDTIHIYHGYRRRRRRGARPATALARTYRHAGRAVGATTLVLTAQFALLGASRFVPTVEFGLLSAVGLVAALLFDLLFLPALLVLVDRPRASRPV